MPSRTFLPIFRAVPANQRWRRRARRSQRCCWKKREWRSCRVKPLARQATCGFPTPRPSNESTKDCAVSNVFSLAPEPLGEAWLTGVDCRIASGPFVGRTLGAAWTEMPVEWRGGQLVANETFPLLVKFIFPTEKLSLQVHPDDAYASVHERAAGGRGKTEMWHAVSTTAGAQLLLGLKPGVDKEKFRQGLASHKLEELFETHAVRTGDTFFVPAGTPHSIGPNMVVCEVQEYSDLTYRVYDFARIDASEI